MSFSKSAKGTAADVNTEIRNDPTVPVQVKQFVSDTLAHDAKHAHGPADLVSVSTNGHVGVNGSVRVEIQFSAAPKPAPKKDEDPLAGGQE